MDAALIRELYEKEDTYWWHVAKRLLLLELAARYFPADGASRVLEVGCGAGRTLKELQAVYGDAWGADSSPVALASCRERGIHSVVAADVERGLPFGDGCFRLAVCADVLEHLRDDAAALRELHRVLAPGGGILLTIPAYPSLSSYWDEALGHFRRYTKGELADRLRAAGFRAWKLSYSNTIVFPAAVAVRRIKGRATRGGPCGAPAGDFLRVPGVVNLALLMVYWAERRLLRYVNLPFGLSLVCAAKKL